MPVETAADREAFVNPAEFGGVAIYTPASGDPSDDISGLFDAPTISVEINEAGSLDARPTFFCREDDLPDDAEGDADDVVQIAVNGVDKGAFKVWSIEPDGQGFVLLRLGATS